MRTRGLGYAVATAALVAGAAACTSSPAGPAWESLALPAPTQRAVTLTAYRDRLLVGTVTTDPAAVPGLLTYDGTAWGALPVRPTSPYAKLAEWLSVQPLPDGRLVAVGGARGGAHSNVRWTVWGGSVADGLTEQEQSFYVFGGWGAGDQTGVVVTGAGPMLVGSWESARTGLDIDVWLPEGAKWVRQDPAGTALESTPTIMAGARGVTAWGDGALVVGSVLRLDQGIAQRPAVWRSTSGNSGWSRIDLPTDAAKAEAVSGACTAAVCTVTGWADGRLAVWRVDARGSATQVTGIPPLPVAERDPVPAPVLVDGRAVVLVGAADPATVVRETETGWRTEAGPPGAAVALVRVQGSLYAVVRGEGATPVVWRRPL